jgi:hypothetical protein
MKGGSQIIFKAKFSAFQKCIDDASVVGKISNMITDIGMGFKRENLAVDTKISNVMIMAELQRSKKGLGVVLTNR